VEIIGNVYKYLMNSWIYISFEGEMRCFIYPKYNKIQILINLQIQNFNKVGIQSIFFLCFIELDFCKLKIFLFATKI